MFPSAFELQEMGDGLSANMGIRDAFPLYIREYIIIILLTYVV